MLNIRWVSIWLWKRRSSKSSLFKGPTFRLKQSYKRWWIIKFNKLLRAVSSFLLWRRKKTRTFAETMFSRCERREDSDQYKHINIRARELKQFQIKWAGKVFFLHISYLFLFNTPLESLMIEDRVQKSKRMLESPEIFFKYHIAIAFPILSCDWEWRAF